MASVRTCAPFSNIADACFRSYLARHVNGEIAAERATIRTLFNGQRSFGIGDQLTRVAVHRTFA